VIDFSLSDEQQQLRDRTFRQGQDQRRQQRGQQRGQQRPQGDPIFSKPYEPSASSDSSAPKAGAPQQSKRRQPQVAALLGGLKRA